MSRARELRWDAELQAYIGVSFRTGQAFTVSAAAVTAEYARRRGEAAAWCRDPAHIEGLAQLAFRCSTYSAWIGLEGVQPLAAARPPTTPLAPRTVRRGQVWISIV